MMIQVWAIGICKAFDCFLVFIISILNWLPFHKLCLNLILFWSPDRVILFYLRISIGLISSFMAKKREIDELKELLKDTENLVQDLQEELEMRDTLLTVKELSNENCESLGIPENSLFSMKEQNLVPSAKSDDKELFIQSAEEGSESLSKIEAELEAELQRLGLNIDTSSTDKGFYDLHEVIVSIDCIIKHVNEYKHRRFLLNISALCVYT